jgi:hypothetical protein
MKNVRAAPAIRENGSAVTEVHTNCQAYAFQPVRGNRETNGVRLSLE